MFTHPSLILRTHVLAALAKIREEWEVAADGEPLTDLEASVGLLLADLAMAIGLTPEEQTQALGLELANELQGILVTVPGKNGHE